MPRSKHRHKKGGKAVAHPGRVRTIHAGIRPLDNTSTRLEEYTRVQTTFLQPIVDAWPKFEQTDPKRYSADVADYILDLAYDYKALTFGPVSKSKLLEYYAAQGSEDVDFLPPPLTVADTEAALAFLVESELVEVEGDAITLHRRFEIARHDGAPAAEAVSAPPTTIETDQTQTASNSSTP
jgi:hypothetical protein